MEIEGVNNMMEVHKNIEDDVVEQILSTLPPKSLMRFKCVSKRWYALITDPRFVAKHFSISKLHNRSTPCVLLKRLVNKDNDSETREVFSMLKFRNNIDNDNDGEGYEHSFVTGVEDIDIPPSLSLKTEGSTLHIIGHCNGIICLVPVISGEVILWNPATHEFKPLPPQPYLPDSPEIVEVSLDWPQNDPLRIHRDYMDSLGFGYDPRSNDYKVVNIGYPGIDYAPNIDVGYDINLPPKTAVYSLSTDSWREMKTFSLETESTIFFPEHFQMCFKGMCYWSGYEQPKEIFFMDSKETWPIIILFDLGEELFHEMLLPDSVTDESVWRQSYQLLVWNESIALFGLQSSRSPNGWESVGIWVIDEFDGPKSPWTKHVSFELTEKPLAFLKSDEILMVDTKCTFGKED